MNNICIPIWSGEKIFATLQFIESKNKNNNNNNHIHICDTRCQEYYLYLYVYLIHSSLNIFIDEGLLESWWNK